MKIMKVIDKKVGDTTYIKYRINLPKKVVEDSGFSLSFIKKTLAKIKEEYDGFHFEKSGNTWLTWKDRDHVIKKLDETCSRFLEEQDKEC